MNATNTKVEEFFDAYAAALLARDARAVAAMYAVPSLIVFPGNVIAVSSVEQTQAFFESSWDQYEGVEVIERDTRIMAEAPGTLWADVTWSHDGKPSERLCYQLIEGEGGYQIGVLTPLELSSS